MTAFDDRIRGRVEAITERTGRQSGVVYRRVTRTTGPNPVQSPPSGTLTGWTAAANAMAGAGSVTISAAGARGGLQAGDQISFPGHGPYALSAAATIVSGQVVAAITPVLTAAVSAGDAVSVAWSGDTTILARVASYPNRMVDGNLILATDLRVIVPGTKLPTRPTPLLDQIVIDGVIHIIVNADPAYAQDQVGLWNIQARVA